MLENGVVIDRQGNPIYWHSPQGRSAGYIPDSRPLWEVLWEHRNNLAGVAHSHPGAGWPNPSYIDLTTFRADEVGLGRPLDWWITSEDRLVVCRRADLDREVHHVTSYPEELASWLPELRQRSYGR